MSVLGLALVHFLWQGTLIALLARLTLRAVPSSSPRERHAVYVLALFALPLLPAATYAWIGDRAATASGTLSAGESSIAETSPISWLALIGWFWLAGATLQELRLMRSYLSASRLRRLDAIALDESWQVVMRELGQRFGLRRVVRVLQSARVQVPCVVGWIEPVVLLPVGALLALTPAELKIVLAHELAHLRRFDPWINALQGAIESLLFFHPAVWWLSARVREEREFCCDDLAIEVCGDPLRFARALTSLESLRGQGGVPSLSSQGGSLMQRIQRLIRHSAEAPGRGPSRLAPFVFATLVVALASAPVYGWISSSSSSSSAHDPLHDPRSQRSHDHERHSEHQRSRRMSAQDPATLRQLEERLADLQSQLVQLEKQLVVARLEVAKNTHGEDLQALHDSLMQRQHKQQRLDEPKRDPRFIDDGQHDPRAHDSHEDAHSDDGRTLEHQLMLRAVQKALQDKNRIQTSEADELQTQLQLHAKKLLYQGDHEAAQLLLKASLKLSEGRHEDSARGNRRKRSGTPDDAQVRVRLAEQRTLGEGLRKYELAAKEHADSSNHEGESRQMEQELASEQPANAGLDHRRLFMRHLKFLAKQKALADALPKDK